MNNCCVYKSLKLQRPEFINQNLLLCSPNSMALFTKTTLPAQGEVNLYVWVRTLDNPALPFASETEKETDYTHSRLVRFYKD